MFWDKKYKEPELKSEAMIRELEEKIKTHDQDSETLDFYTGYDDKKENIEDITNKDVNPFYCDEQFEKFSKTRRFQEYGEAENPDLEGRYKAEYREIFEDYEPYYYMSKDTYKRFIFFIGVISLGISLIFLHFIKCWMNNDIIGVLNELMYRSGRIPFGKNYYEWALTIFTGMIFGGVVFLKLYTSRKHIIGRDIIVLMIISCCGAVATFDGYLYSTFSKTLTVIFFSVSAVAMLYSLVSFQKGLKKSMRAILVLISLSLLFCTSCKLMSTPSTDNIVLIGAFPEGVQRVIDKHGLKTPSFLYYPGEDPNVPQSSAEEVIEDESSKEISEESSEASEFSTESEQSVENFDENSVDSQTAESES